MMIKRICELRGIISSDQALRPHFHLRRYKLFVVLIAWTTSPPGQTWEVRQKWHYLLTGANTGLRHEHLWYIFFPVHVNPLQSLKIPASISLHMHSHYLIFRHLLGTWDDSTWTAPIVMNIAYLCKLGVELLGLKRVNDKTDSRICLRTILRNSCSANRSDEFGPWHTAQSLWRLRAAWLFGQNSEQLQWECCLSNVLELDLISSALLSSQRWCDDLYSRLEPSGSWHTSLSFFLSSSTIFCHHLQMFFSILCIGNSKLVFFIISLLFYSL